VPSAARTTAGTASGEPRVSTALRRGVTLMWMHLPANEASPQRPRRTTRPLTSTAPGARHRPLLWLFRLIVSGLAALIIFSSVTTSRFRDAVRVSILRSAPIDRARPTCGPREVLVPAPPESARRGCGRSSGQTTRLARVLARGVRRRVKLCCRRGGDAEWWRDVLERASVWPCVILLGFQPVGRMPLAA